MERGMILQFRYKTEDNKWGNYQVISLGEYNGYLHALEIAGRNSRNVINKANVDLLAKKFGLKHIYNLGRYKGVDIPKIDFRRSARRVYAQVIKKRTGLTVGYRTFLWNKVPNVVSLQDPQFGSDVMASLFPKPGDPIKMLNNQVGEVISGYPVLKVKMPDDTIKVINHHIKLSDGAGRPTYLETKDFT